MEAVKYLIEIRLGLSCGLKKSATGLGGRVVGGASCKSSTAWWTSWGHGTLLPSR
jgi:hypothetical protein